MAKQISKSSPSRSRSTTPARSGNQFLSQQKGFRKPVILGILVLASTLGVYVTFRTFAGGNPAIVSAAASQVGVSESPLGSNYGPVIKYYTDYNAEPWCADFVSWVYRKAGTPFTGGASGGWRIASTNRMEDWFRNNGVWRNRTSTDIPQPGDAVFFDWNNDGRDDHAGIVNYTSGSTLYTIEGNSSNRVNRRTYYNYKSNPDIKGWGRKSGTSTSTSTAPTAGTSSQYFAYCPSPQPLIKYGSTGNCVKLAEDLLNKKIGAGLTVDGQFGPGTLSATKTFQSRNGLVVDGVIGDKTWYKLKQ